jgi:4-hydroxy-tetrahydrodipicolinate reductase
MGTAILAELKEHHDLCLTAAICRTNGLVLPGHPDVATRSSWDDRTELNVILDVSVPSGTDTSLRFAREHGIPFVTGVTGLPIPLENDLVSASAEIPVFVASNFSPGVAAVTRALSLLATMLNGYEIGVIDLHHSQKRDAPSGTGRALVQAINSGLAPERHITDASIVSLRLGGNPGEHEVVFATTGEEVAVRHRALSRAAFARGAIMAARWISTQPPGHYGMAEMTT